MRLSKHDIFDELRSEYESLKEQKWAGRDYFGNWFRSDINNADLALFESYEGGVCAFSNLFELAGEDFIEFHRLAGVRAELGSRNGKIG